MSTTKVSLRKEDQAALKRILEHLEEEYENFIVLPPKERETHVYQDARNLHYLVYPHYCFDFGKLWVTEGARDALKQAGQEPEHFIRRYGHGDWGDLGPDDWFRNIHALEDGGRVFAAYRTSLGTKIWIITDAEQHDTTILLPEEY